MLTFVITTIPLAEKISPPISPTPHGCGFVPPGCCIIPINNHLTPTELLFDRIGSLPFTYIGYAYYLSLFR